MREIKFRVFDKISKQMYRWSQIASISLVDFEKEHYELMQFTGLQDKNGVDIYEGDIVIHGIIKAKSIVIHKEGSFCLDNEKSRHDTCIRHFDLKELNVIGSIHENPNLLK